MASLVLIPPRIAGIQVYDEQTGRKEMDVDFLYAGDLEILFSFKGFPHYVNSREGEGSLSSHYPKSPNKPFLSKLQ